MDAEDSATVFLETSLGTNIAVSFPANITSIADLKRQVAAEHSVSFPVIGPIAVTSLQVKSNNIWYVLSDSMAVKEAFIGIEGGWHLQVEAHTVAKEDMSPPAASQEEPVDISSGDILDTRHRAVEYISCRCEDGSTMNLGVPACTATDRPLMNQQGERHRHVENAFGPRQDDNSMPQQDSNIDVTADIVDGPLLNQQDQEGVGHGHSQHNNGNTMPQQSADLAVAADKDSGMLGGQQNVSIPETRTKKRFREENKNDESNIINLYYGSLTCLASYRDNGGFSGMKSNGAENAILNNDPLLRILGHRSNVHGAEFLLCSDGTMDIDGETSNNISNFRPCIDSIEGNNSSDKELKAHISEEEELQVAGFLRTTESRCEGIDIPHCVESMKEDSRRPTSSNLYLDMGDEETAIAEHEACFQRIKRFVAVRKVPLSRFRNGSSADANQVSSIKCKNWSQKLKKKQNNSEETIKSRLRSTSKEVPVGQRATLRKKQNNSEETIKSRLRSTSKEVPVGQRATLRKNQNNSEETIKSRLRTTNKEVPVVQRAILKKIELNLEEPDVSNTGSCGRSAQQHGAEEEEARKRGKKKRKTVSLSSLLSLLLRQDRGVGMLCEHDSCSKQVQENAAYCKLHSGVSKRCVVRGCTRGAQGGTSLCIGHGGGKRCIFPGCPKAACGNGCSDRCVSHGGGKRCKFDGCANGVQGNTDCCIRHGGGRRCKHVGCTKSAQGRSELCIKHGGGNRCKFKGCGTSAKWGTDFCSVHSKSLVGGDNGIPEALPASSEKKRRAKKPL